MTTLFKLDYTISNHRAFTRILVLEPWGAEYSIGPQEKMTISFESPGSGLLEMEESDDSIVVFAWPGSSAKVRNAGQVFEHDRVPDVPPGMTTRDFLCLLLGRGSERTKA